jgi:hypothetical protein
MSGPLKENENGCHERQEMEKPMQAQWFQPKGYFGAASEQFMFQRDNA